MFLIVFVLVFLDEVSKLNVENRCRLAAQQQQPLSEN